MSHLVDFWFEDLLEIRLELLSDFRKPPVRVANLKYLVFRMYRIKVVKIGV